MSGRLVEDVHGVVGGPASWGRVCREDSGETERAEVYAVLVVVVLWGGEEMNQCYHTHYVPCSIIIIATKSFSPSPPPPPLPSPPLPPPSYLSQQLHVDLRDTVDGSWSLYGEVGTELPGGTGTKRSDCARAEEP